MALECVALGYYGVELLVEGAAAAAAQQKHDWGEGAPVLEESEGVPREARRNLRRGGGEWPEINIDRVGDNSIPVVNHERRSVAQRGLCRPQERAELRRRRAVPLARHSRAVSRQLHGTHC